MKRQYNFLIIFLASLVVFFACDNNRIFEKNRAIPEKGWNKDSVVSFEIQITDTLQKHNLYINVRNDIKYKYSNLWLFVDINHPQNNTVTDTFEITLAESSGKWLGEGFGGIKNQQIIYRKNLNFPVSGEYKINIMQGMREDVLAGITDIGIRLEKQE